MPRLGPQFPADARPRRRGNSCCGSCFSRAAAEDIVLEFLDRPKQLPVVQADVWSSVVRKNATELLEGILGATGAGSLARAFSSGLAAEDASSRPLIARCSSPWLWPYSTRLTSCLRSKHSKARLRPGWHYFFCASKPAASSERNRS